MPTTVTIFSTVSQVKIVSLLFSYLSNLLSMALQEILCYQSSHGLHKQLEAKTEKESRPQWDNSERSFPPFLDLFKKKRTLSLHNFLLQFIVYSLHGNFDSSSLKSDSFVKLYMSRRQPRQANTFKGLTWSDLFKGCDFIFFYCLAPNAPHWICISVIYLSIFYKAATWVIFYFFLNLPSVNISMSFNEYQHYVTPTLWADQWINENESHLCAAH